MDGMTINHIVSIDHGSYKAILGGYLPYICLFIDLTYGRYLQFRYQTRSGQLCSRSIFLLTHCGGPHMLWNVGSQTKHYPLVD